MSRDWHVDIAAIASNRDLLDDYQYQQCPLDPWRMNDCSISIRTPEEFEIGLIPRGQMRPPTPALNPQISLAGELKMKIRL